MEGVSSQINKEEEKNFVKLFHEVLEKNKGDLSPEDIEEGVEEAKEIFKKNVSRSFVKENLDTPKIICGAFYRYSPLYAGTTRARILTALRDCEEFKSFFSRTSLNILDVGSGPGSGLVGLYSALDSYEEKVNGEIIRGLPFQSLEATSVDYIKRWENFFTGIELKLRNREVDFGNASRLFREKEIKWQFLCCNLLEYKKLALIKQLKEADIIFMKGFITVLERDESRRGVCKAITSEMKKGSLLVIIESPTYETYFQNKNLRLVFTTRSFSTGPEKTPDLKDFYRLDARPSILYGGLALQSNQQIFILEKL